MILLKCCGYDAPIFRMFHLRSVVCTHTLEYLHFIDHLSVDIFATDFHVRRQWITPEQMLSAKFYTGVTIWVCKRVEFVIRSVNNLKTACARWKVCVWWFRHAGIHARIFLCVCYKHVDCSSTQCSSVAVPSCRNDNQPSLQYLATIFPSSPIPRVSRDFGLPRCRFPCNSFFIAHFTSSQATSLIACLKEESLRRTQIRIAIWWCSEYFGLYGYQSNWFATSDNRSTILLIRPFSHQLSAESSLLRHRWELSIPASVLVSCSHLCVFLCLSRSVHYRAFLTWPFQFGIWFICYEST